MTTFIKKVVRGDITIPITVFSAVALGAVGFFATVVFSTTTSISNKIEKTDDKVNTNTTEIATLKARVERLPYIEGKLDELLANRGIDPAKVLPASVISATNK